MSPRRGIPFVVSAPSGTGKTTVCKEVVARDARVSFSISHTTRKMRPGESDGADYHFVTREEFAALRTQDCFAEHAEYAGNLYGTSHAALDGPLAAGRDLLLEVEVQGAAQLRARRSDARFIFLLPPSRAELKQRLLRRDTDGESVLRKRQHAVEIEYREVKNFDYVVVNEELQRTVSALLEIMQAERQGKVETVRKTHGSALVLQRVWWDTILKTPPQRRRHTVTALKKQTASRRKNPAVLNRTVFTRDNLEVMRGMDSGSVDLIYLDPPFNKKKQLHAPTGSAARGASFKDWWIMDYVKFEYMEQLERKHPDLVSLIYAAGQVGHRSTTPYLLYMAPRLIEMHRILKSTGSLYLHCDQTIGHYLKLLLDGIFGHEHFQNEIAWGYKTGGASKKRFARKHDTLFFYSKTSQFYFNPDTFLRDVWDTDDIKAIISTSKERVGYPTQKPMALMERIICASSKPDDMVLDPFCGSATTLVAAEKHHRQWIGIDVSPRAIRLVSRRIEQEIDSHLFEPIHRRDIPVRGDRLRRTANAALKRRLYDEQSGYCKICKAHFDIRNMALDHIVATSVGGPDSDDNIQLLCTACNSMKDRRSREWALAHFKEHWRRR